LDWFMLKVLGSLGTRGNWAWPASHKPCQPYLQEVRHNGEWSTW